MTVSKKNTGTGAKTRPWRDRLVQLGVRMRFILLLVVAMATARGPGVVAAENRAAKASPAQKAKTVRLLTVGNSFSQNPMHYLGDLATESGHILIHHQAVFGTATLAQHWAKVEQHEKDPQDKRGLYGMGRSLEQELLAEPWDFVTIQLRFRQKATILDQESMGLQPNNRQGPRGEKTAEG